MAIKMLLENKVRSTTHENWKSVQIISKFILESNVDTCV